MLYNILTKQVTTNIKLKLKLCPLLLLYYIFPICKGTKIFKYTYINNIFGNTTIQNCLYPFSFCLFTPWIHVHNSTVNIFKFSIHYILVFRRITNNIQGLFDQRKCSFVIGIIYPSSDNTYGMIDIASSVNQLNQLHTVTDGIQNIKFTCFIYLSIL